MTWTDDNDHALLLRSQADGLIDFARGSLSDQSGCGWMDDHGVIDMNHDRELWITCRMAHCFALGTLIGHTECDEAMARCLDALRHLFHDDEFGGWHQAMAWDDTPHDATKAAYPHAFVILAASSAVTAGDKAATDLLDEALHVSEEYFWDESYGMVVEQWDRGFAHLDPYRGVNANMHTVEAYLAAADVFDSILGRHDKAELWRTRAIRIIDRVINHNARANQWRIPEHFDTSWNPLLDFNRDHPADQFRPYGATIGHGFEWARLILQANASHPVGTEWMPDAARELYRRARGDGWAVDGHDGFVYTTDWSGHPIVHERMHWVVAEAMNTAYYLGYLGIDNTQADYAAWWEHTRASFIDTDLGSWHHELDRENHPSSTVWDGKPDVYHALQACLIPLVAPGMSIAPALAMAASTR